MTDREDIDALAAEFVLGTLELSERRAVAARRAREPDLAAAISAWEQRLAPLHELSPAITPPPAVWAGIEARLSAVASTSAAANVVALERRITGWRRAAIAASAIAASLVVFVGGREIMRQPEPERFVAVFQKDDALPSFLLSIDLKTRELTIRPIAAEGPPGKTYQLWIASDKIGPSPQSLGLLEASLQPTRKRLSTYDSALLETATFGISLEPAGGSPTGRPTGPVLHGKLYPSGR